MKICAVVDNQSGRTSFVGIPVVPSFDAIEEEVDGVVVTDLATTAETIELHCVASTAIACWSHHYCVRAAPNARRRHDH